MFDVLDRGGASPAAVQSGSPPLGQVLLERGLVTSEQLEYALAEQTRTGLPLGQVLIGLSYVTASTIAQALATQYGGVVKTEYGFATGFDSNLAATAPSVPPPVSPMQAPVSRVEAEEPAAPPPPVLLTAKSRAAELELEVASARQEEQVARREELHARQELAAAQASGDQLGAAAARIAELETSHAEMKRQLQASMERSEQLERELTEVRMGAVDELQRTQHELRAAYARLHEYEIAAAVQPQRPAADPMRTVSPFAWQS